MSEMKKLTQAVKDEALKKWSFRAKTVDEMRYWWNNTGERACSFCRHFGIAFYDCICPLKDNEYACCREYSNAENAAMDGSMERFNKHAELLYNRISALPIDLDEDNCENKEV